MAEQHPLGPQLEALVTQLGSPDALAMPLGDEALSMLDAHAPEAIAALAGLLGKSKRSPVTYREAYDAIARAASELGDLTHDLTGGHPMVALREEDLAVRVYTPPGGTQETAVQILHTPTGLSALSDTRKSLLQNKAVAMVELRQKVAEHRAQSAWEAAEGSDS